MPITLLLFNRNTDKVFLKGPNIKHCFFHQCILTFEMMVRVFHLRYSKPQLMCRVVRLHDRPLPNEIIVLQDVNGKEKQTTKFIKNKRKIQEGKKIIAIKAQC